MDSRTEELIDKWEAIAKDAREKASSPENTALTSVMLVNLAGLMESVSEDVKKIAKYESNKEQNESRTKGL